jgi:hypothetical protein
VNPFRITCTTCRARLKIVDPAAVGQILACPKCNSMVQAVPPDDWTPDGPATPDSVVLGSSVTIRALDPSPGAKNLPSTAGAAAPAGRATPPPLPSRILRVKPAVASSQQTAAVEVAASPQTGIRWFWPVFGGATFVSLAVAALVIYLQHKDRAGPVVADAPGRTSQNAPEKPVKPPDANPAPANSAATNQAASAQPVAAAPPPNPPATNPAPKPAAANSPTGEPPATVEAKRAPANGSAESVPEVAVKLTDVKPPVAATKSPADNSAPQNQNETAGHPTEKPVTDAEIPKAQPVPADVAMPNGPAPRPIRPSVEKVPPKAVDVETHLTDPLAGINYRAIPLARLVADLSQLSTIPISLDADALAELNVAPDVPITLRTKETTVAGVLEEALGPLGLSYSIVGHQLIISRLQQGELRRVRYAVSDLAGETAASTAAFSGLVQAIVDPAAWKQAGGKATGQWIDGALVVTAGESTHAQLLVFCEKLRVARKLPLRSKIDPARFRLEPRTTAAAAMLAEPVTANFGRPESLARILSYLRGTTQLTMLVDQAALAEQRTSIDMEGTLVADHQPLGQSLTALLDPMELTWRVVGPRAIEITTPQAAARHGEVEFYPAGEMAADAGGEALVARIDRELAAAADPDPQVPRPVIRFDAKSRELVVRASQSVQLRLAALLNEWRIAKK